MQSSLQRAASLLGIEHTEEFQRFTVVTRVAGEPEAAIGVALMDAIGLDCRFPWPLQLLFPDRAVSAYNTMFRFLLSMRHAQASLNQSWQWLRRQIRTAAPSDEPVLADAATLRSQLSVLVNGVQDYIQVDVISLRWGGRELRVGLARTALRLCCTPDIARRFRGRGGRRLLPCVVTSV